MDSQSLMLLANRYSSLLCPFPQIFASICNRLQLQECLDTFLQCLYPKCFNIVQQWKYWRYQTYSQNISPPFGLRRLALADIHIALCSVLLFSEEQIQNAKTSFRYNSAMKKNKLRPQIELVELLDGHHRRRQRAKQQQKTAFLKKSAVQLLLQANMSVAEQKYEQAKNLIISAMDYCREIDNPDEYTKKLMELCYEETTIIRRESTKKRHKERHVDTYHRIIYETSHSVVVLPFDKARGQFAMQNYQYLSFQEEGKGAKFSQQIQFQVSKLNAIVFDYNNTEHSSSLAHMYDIYKTELLVSGFLLVFMLVTLFLSMHALGYLPKQMDQDTLQMLTVVVPSAACLFPLIMIFLRQQRNKNSDIYQARFDQELKRINLQSANECVYSLDQANNLNVILRDLPSVYKSA